VAFGILDEGQFATGMKRRLDSLTSSPPLSVVVYLLSLIHCARRRPLRCAFLREFMALAEVSIAEFRSLCRMRVISLLSFIFVVLSCLVRLVDRNIFDSQTSILLQLDFCALLCILLCHLCTVNYVLSCVV
jgi:hypothetical protein